MGGFCHALLRNLFAVKVSDQKLFYSIREYERAMSWKAQQIALARVGLSRFADKNIPNSIRHNGHWWFVHWLSSKWLHNTLDYKRHATSPALQPVTFLFVTSGQVAAFFTDVRPSVNQSLSQTVTARQSAHRQSAISKQWVKNHVWVRSFSVYKQCKGLHPKSRFTPQVNSIIF